MAPLESTVQIKHCEPGQIVMVQAVVIKQNGGQTLCWAPGVGGSGQWSIVNSVMVEPSGDPLSDLQMEALQALAAFARGADDVIAQSQGRT